MKSSIKMITAIAFVFVAICTSCMTSSEKVNKAKEEVGEANQNLEDEREAYLIEVEEYKKSTTAQIEANEKSIAEFNARIATQKKELRADYEKEIAALNSKNSDMKKEIADFRAENKSNWEVFKAKFNADMKDLGDEFRNFTIKDKK